MHAQIAEERKKCQHMNLTIKPGADTGNYCKADDSYWIDIKCHDCGRTWHYNSDQPEYRMTDGITIER